MSFVRPTLNELIQRGQDDLNARLPGADSRLRRSVLGALVTVVCGAIYGLYGYIHYLSRQILPDTAEGDFLVRHAAIYSVTKKPATLARGPIVVKGVNGQVIDAGAVFQRADGVAFSTQASATISAGEATVTVAAVQAGVAGQSAAGTRLTLVSPIAGITSAAVVGVGGLVSGTDEEDEEQLRDRLLERIAAKPEGGAEHDYRRWTREMPEVTRAWVFKGWMGAGTVGIAFAMDDRPNPFPTEADVDLVQEHLDEVAPVTAEVIVFAPEAQLLNLTISQLAPNSAAVKAAIATEVADFLYRSAEPGGTILISQLREAISTAADENDHVLTSPTQNIVAGAGKLIVLGGITYV